jgi:hypothetical protein
MSRRARSCAPPGDSRRSRRRRLASQPPPVPAVPSGRGASPPRPALAAHRFVLPSPPSSPASPLSRRSPRRLPKTLLPSPASLPRTPRRLPGTLLPSPAPPSRPAAPAARTFRLIRVRRPGEVFAAHVRKKLGALVCGGSVASADELSPARIWVSHAPSPRRAQHVNRFLVGNALTWEFSTYADRFRVSELSVGVFVAPVSCAAVARMLRRRAAFVFAGELFRFHLEDPSASSEQRSGGVDPVLELTFGTLACPPIPLQELTLRSLAPRVRCAPPRPIPIHRLLRPGVRRRVPDSPANRSNGPAH